MFSTHHHNKHHSDLLRGATMTYSQLSHPRDVWLPYPCNTGSSSCTSGSFAWSMSGQKVTFRIPVSQEIPLRINALGAAPHGATPLYQQSPEHLQKKQLARKGFGHARLACSCLAHLTPLLLPTLHTRRWFPWPLVVMLLGFSRAPGTDRRPAGSGERCTDSKQR